MKNIHEIKYKVKIIAKSMRTFYALASKNNRKDKKKILEVLLKIDNSINK